MKRTFWADFIGVCVCVCAASLLRRMRTLVHTPYSVKRGLTDGLRTMYARDDLQVNKHASEILIRREATTIVPVTIQPRPIIIVG